MAKSSYVLQALKILVPEEILKLSELLHTKMAVGAEFVEWDNSAEASSRDRPPHRTREAKVLAFPQKSKDSVPLPEQDSQIEEEASSFLSSDQLLWHRQLARQTGETIHKVEALKGYRKSTEMNILKLPGEEGEDTSRFASTNGVLINKKQA